MTNAFQSLGFQHPGFQGGLAKTPTPQLGKPKKGKHRRHKITVEIDGEEFEVSSLEEGRELLLRARAMAREAAERAAAKALAKAAKKGKPAAVDRAMAVPVPRIAVRGPDGSDLILQQLRASAEAAQAAIEAIYLEVLQAARRRFEDEEDIAILLLHL